MTSRKYANVWQAFCVLTLLVGLQVLVPVYQNRRAIQGRTRSSTQATSTARVVCRFIAIDSASTLDTGSVMNIDGSHSRSTVAHIFVETKKC
jgi:hypothetical protein